MMNRITTCSLKLYKSYKGYLSESKGYVMNFGSKGTSGRTFLNWTEHSKSFLNVITYVIK